MIALLIKYRYAIAALSVLAALWGYGEIRAYTSYQRGKNDCKAAYEEANRKSEDQSQKGASDVRKKIQSLDERELNTELCRLGIVQQNRGC